MISNENRALFNSYAKILKNLKASSFGERQRPSLILKCECML